MSSNGFVQGVKGSVIKRGAAESFSIYARVRVHGTEKTTQKMPHTRILGLYFNAQKPDVSGGAFAGDSENEFVALAEGVEFDYT